MSEKQKKKKKTANLINVIYKLIYLLFKIQEIFPSRLANHINKFVRESCKSGPGCSKLTTSLVNVSLTFQTLISQIRQYFWLKKCENAKASLILSTKNISVFGYKVVKHLTS